ncbi:MAG TPA: hypothetical protein VMU30_00925 [Bacteroidota bacterium]|nr:hypothetical protein [Bacteroidota bacterium]
MRVNSHVQTHRIKEIFFVVWILCVILDLPLQAQCGMFCKYSGPPSMRCFGIARSSDRTMFIVGGDTAAIGTKGYISKITPTGEEKIFVPLSASFIGPGIDVDSTQNIFIACGSIILKVSPEGRVDTLLQNFRGAFDIKLDRKGNLFIADHIEDKIYKVTPSLQKSVFIDNHPVSSGSFMLGCLCFDKEYNNLYSAEPLKKMLKKYPINRDGTAGAPDTILSDGPLIYSFDIDDKGTIYAIDFQRAAIVQISGKNQFQYLASDCMLKDPIGMRISSPGFHLQTIFIADSEGIKELKQNNFPFSPSDPSKK